MANNPAKIRTDNENQIIQELYWNDELTIQEIADITGLSLPTVMGIIKKYKEIGLFIDGEKLISTGGRKPVKVKFNYDYRYSAGVEVRKTQYIITVINLKGDILCEQTYDIPFSNIKKYWREINENIELLIENIIPKKKILGVGISFPGEVSVSGDTIDRAVILGITNQPLPQIKSQFDWPSYIDNGANTAGLAAIWRRRDLNDAVYLLITSSGVAGSILINREIFHTSSSAGRKSGAFGHTILQPKGKPCFCGSRGCWSAYSRIDELTRYTDGDLDLFFRKVDRNDEEMCAVWEEYLDYLTQGIINVKQALDLDIIIGGPLGAYLENFLPDIKKRIDNHPSLIPNYTNIYIDNVSGNVLSIGAAIIFIEKMITGKISLTK